MIPEVNNENKEDSTWESCCFNIDPQACIFFSQLTISVGCIGFSIYQSKKLISSYRITDIII